MTKISPQMAEGTMERWRLCHWEQEEKIQVEQQKFTKIISLFTALSSFQGFFPKACWKFSSSFQSLLKTLNFSPNPAAEIQTVTPKSSLSSWFYPHFSFFFQTPAEKSLLHFSVSSKIWIFLQIFLQLQLLSHRAPPAPNPLLNAQILFSLHRHFLVFVSPIFHWDFSSCPAPKGTFLHFCAQAQPWQQSSGGFSRAPSNPNSCLESVKCQFTAPSPPWDTGGGCLDKALKQDE